MILTEIYGTILGGFINYAVMIFIVNGICEVLADSDGNSSRSGATMQSYNTNATSWALAKHLSRGFYSLVPIGLGVSFGIVIVHQIIAYFVPRIRGYTLSEINLP
ncbi:hypothetical protein LZ30DRAFT_667117 [Colletotrichum cereale]|nr:hypothetical protein LZ30DRAFT_667117 [Colletotrichum cereale]